ncbi:hypothetical protein ACUNG5_11030 [Serratia sp. IR-2025]
MTLTTERLKQLAEPNMCSWDEYKSMIAELLANREAQPVMWRYRYRRGPHKGYWTYVGRKSECPTRPFHEIQGLYTAPPAPAIPDIGSSVVNDAAWKLHDTLTKYGPLNGHQFNHLKSCLYEALKIVMTAPPAQAAPEKN